MIEDFGSLAELDLTDSFFICNEGVEKFVLMASEKDGLEIKGYVEGWGYSCKTSNNEVKSFASYVVSNTRAGSRGPKSASPPQKIKILKIGLKYGKYLYKVKSV